MDRNLILALIAAASLVPSCKSLPGVPETKKPPVEVRTLTVGNQSVSSMKSYVGKVESSRTDVITSPYSGTLTALRVRQGQRVSAGEVVAKINSETVNSAYDIAKATLQQAQDGYDRIDKVRGNGSVSELKIVEVETDLSKAQSSFNAARTALENCSLKAPFSGTVSEVSSEQGVELVPGTPVVKIMDLGRIDIMITVPESEISRIRVGDAADMTIPALSDMKVKARVTEKGINADMLSHSYTCLLAPQKSIRELLPGMVCKIEFSDSEKNSGQTEENIVIPATVIRADADGRYVWTVNSGNVVEKTRITIGEFSGKGVIVSGGLASGDRVIVEGSQKVSTGMKVVEAE